MYILIFHQTKKMTEIEQRKNELFDYVMMVCKMGIMPDIKKLNILINKFQIAVQKDCEEQNEKASM